MSHVIALLSLIVRLFRPVRGLHAAPRALRREVRRANRVRRYAKDIPTVATADNTLDVPRVPAPRPAPDVAPPRTLGPVPADYVPVVDPSAVAAPAAIVRGHYRAYEARQERARIDRDRLGVAVLADIARVTQRAEVSA
ncbi:hypothetical protein KIK06_23085 [Nocardiopsis sp. EMB25]|uniref:hypothetical protein n=1 Tax=Nocardiopsis sp. EMB25 TaxID=2835867 RepID=UPI00228364E5|nr:hypothetical protein [Nocardiopsis sp. EMB25]MCY9786773.1 hypothetical protein [Nocardiopsis sp. EMB25]